ncbi:MAG: hypothetical protein PHI28_05645 [Mangrovibacterium sp.]|nr:hypothetical protein [Mangrovibacterium sp.]
MVKLIILFTMMPLLSCTRKPVADTMMIHGKIITVDGHFTIAEAVAIKAGKIIAVGTTREIGWLAERWFSRKGIDTVRAIRAGGACRGVPGIGIGWFYHR